MSNLDDLSIFDMFRMEAEEQVEQLQTRLLALREGDANATALRSLMRGAHSLKGAARIVGLNAAVRLTHAMEERFVAAQEGQALAAPEVDTLLRCVDLLSRLAKISEADAMQWSMANEAAIDGLVSELTTAEASTISPGQDAAVEAQANAQPEARPAAAAPANEAGAADFNLRIGTQRFDRIIAISSDGLVQAQALVRLQETLRATAQRLERAALSLAEVCIKAVAGNHETAEIVTAAVARTARHRASLRAIIEDFDRLSHSHELNVDGLHREVLYARMRPFGDIGSSLRRLVRDTAVEMGKQVRFEIIGERSEVDRDILERLRAPLEHLLRNALDHGLETCEERIAAGKPPEAAIRLRASHQSGRLAISVADDGRGIDIAFVLRRAVERGLVLRSVAEQLSNAEILEFLFLPGFSTRVDVTEISGRGFGLDVVQSIVHEAGGSVRIENRPGIGATFHITLPVSRSLMRVMRVQLDGEVYAMPLTRLSRVATLSVRVEADGSATVAVASESGERRVPVVSMMDALQNAATSLAAGPATVLFLLDSGGAESEIAFQVDRVVDETTVAVRRLDPRLGRMAAIAAVTLTEHNVPMLIVEPDDILRLAVQAQRRHVPQQASSTGRGSILLVDDSATVRQMLRRTLVRAGYHVATAEQGAEAWNLLQVSPFDLLISDVDMPEMNGIELVERVRGNARLGPMPIVLLSYKGREEDRRRGLEAGADAYVTKGEFEEGSFLQTVLDLVGPAEIDESKEAGS